MKAKVMIPLAVAMTDSIMEMIKPILMTAIMPRDHVSFLKSYVAARQSSSAKPKNVSIWNVCAKRYRNSTLSIGGAG